MYNFSYLSIIDGYVYYTWIYSSCIHLLFRINNFG